MKRILFQGDSITDAHRLRDNDRFPGSGYPTLLNARICADRPGQYECINRGISGDRVVDLYARIKRDFILLKPDIVSILIGINDVWHEFTHQTGVDAEKYEMVYGLILDELERALPDVRLALLEPFVLPGAATEDTPEAPARYEYMHSETRLRAEAVKRLADRHGAAFVPLQDAFDEACLRAPAETWLIDGVHPTGAGHELIARRWLSCVAL